MALLELFKEPMLILLIAVAIIYFILRSKQWSLFYVETIVAVSGISFTKTIA
jgi:Ca2+-transporting ATPase